MQAADVAPTPVVGPQLDRILSGVCRQIDKSMRRHFYPKTATYTLYPDGYVDPDSHLWTIEVPDLLSVTSVVVDGVTTTDYVLTSLGSGPYTTLSLTGRTGEKFVIEGTWGYTDNTTGAGTLVGDINASVTTLVVSDSSKVGVGDLLKLGTERVVVVAASMTDSGVNISADISALNSDTSISVGDGSVFNVAETILVGTERMIIIDIAGNTLSVLRAAEGTTLASHTSGADIYVPRSLTVERGATGSTAASHSSGVAVSRFLAPGPIRSLALAEALTAYEQEKGAYGRVVGSGEGQREASGKGLADVRKMAGHYRRLRVASI